MGRLQSSVGLVTGTNITGTVDQLIKISGQPRDRLVSRTDALRREQDAVSSLTAQVIGVQLAGNQLGKAGLFATKTATSSNNDALSVQAGKQSVASQYTVKTIATAATHTVKSRQRVASADTALGFSGKLSIAPSGFLDQTTSLADLNGGRGVEAGKLRITDRSGKSAEIDLSSALTIDDVITAIDDADVGIKATTQGGKLKLIDLTGRTDSNLKVEQLGNAETAADLGLWGVDVGADSFVGDSIELPAGTTSLRGTPLSELRGGSGLGTLGSLDITLSDGTTAAIDLSAAATTSEVIDAIAASGLDLIVRLNDARNGFQIRDVSGGNGNLTIASSDDTASRLGLAADGPDKIVVGSSLQRQSVTSATLLADLNQGSGPTTGSFTITDSAGVAGAISLTSGSIKTVGQLVDAINALSADVTASINQAGDGIAIIDNAGGGGTLKIADAGSGVAAAKLGIAGTATPQTIGSNTVSGIVGTQSDVIDIAGTDTLATIAKKINDGRYGKASVQRNGDGTFSLSILSRIGGAKGQLAVNSDGFELDLQTVSRAQDARISVTDESGNQRLLTSSDGVFRIDDGDDAGGSINAETSLSSLANGLGVGRGSFTITDSTGKIAAVNLTAEAITTVAGLIDRINTLGLGVTASINEAGDGIAIVDTAGGTKSLEIKDFGNGRVAANLGIAGTATTQTIDGVSVKALVGGNKTDESSGDGGIVLTLKALSAETINVNVTQDNKAVVSAAKTFVDQFNRLADNLDKLTAFDAEKQEVGLLFGSSVALRIDTGYGRLLSGSTPGTGEVNSLGAVGIRLNDQGKLELDEDKLTTALTDRREGVVNFFTAADVGIVDQLGKLADSLAGVGNSVLLTRTETLSIQIQRNGERVDVLNKRLDSERERLLKQFYATEDAIAKLQSNQSAIGSIERITIPDN